MEFLPVRDLKVCCRSIGTGYPLVLIMGLTAHMDWWDKELIDALAERYQVLMFDNRGAGRTSTPEEGNFTCEMLADDTIALMDVKHIARANILGVSMGGLIAQQLAIRYSERVNKLILGCTFCGARHMIQPKEEVMQMLMDKSGGLKEVFHRTTELMFTEKFIRNRQDYIADFQERYLRAPISGKNALRQFLAIGQSDTYDRLPQVKNLTLVMTGTEDRLVPPQNSQILTSRIPHAKLVQYEDTGHGFYTEAREAFTKDVIDFLEKR